MGAITINHIAVVVGDVEEALRFWRDALGIIPDHVEHNAEEGVDIAFLAAGDGAIELLAPFVEDSGVAKFLAKRGAGLHHLCLTSAISTACWRG